MLWVCIQVLCAIKTIPFYEFVASVVYRTSSTTAGAVTYKNPVLKNQNQPTNQLNKQKTVKNKNRKFPLLSLSRRCASKNDIIKFLNLLMDTCKIVYKL